MANKANTTSTIKQTHEILLLAEISANIPVNTPTTQQMLAPSKLAFPSLLNVLVLVPTPQFRLSLNLWA
jgi:hypothetical protein